jgi:hypothetical protein
MIIYPQSLVLAAPITLKHMRLGWHTYTRGALPSAITVSTETAEGPKDAPLRSDTYSYWLGSAMPATYKFNLGSLKDVSYIGVAAHTCGSVGATVEAETSTDDSAWTDFGGSVFQTDDTPIMFLDESRSTQWIRLTFTGATPPRMGVLYVGEVLAMMRPIFVGHSPIVLSRVTEMNSIMSEGGQFLGRSYKRFGVRTSVNFNNLTGAWYRSEFDPFVKAARKYPYFAAWRPLDFPGDVGYVQTDDDIKPTNERGGHMTVGWDMYGIGNE